MIRYFAGHATAANLLMAGFFLIGLIMLPELLRETFPRISAKDVRVSVTYPGASPDEVQRSICQRIEDAIDGIENVDETRCEARENIAVATVSMNQGHDLSQFFTDIQTEVEAIDDFPATAEDPIFTELGRTDFVASIALTGPEDRTQLKALAEQIKTDMLAYGGIPKVEIKGFSDRQIRIAINDQAARELGLSLEDVADAISRQNVDLPAGEIVSFDGTTNLRFADERRALDSYQDIIVASSGMGAQIRLGEIAIISDRFEDVEVKTLFNGRQAALLDVTKTISDDTIEVVTRVTEFIRDYQPNLSPGTELSITRDTSQILMDRLQMLTVNSVQGLALVFLVMWLFFGMRQAFWIGMGLPVSFLGALAMMTFMGYSINMLSMVALLIVIGILMDDAIVIAENIATKRENGMEPLEAAIEGAKQVSPSILASFITTVAIFGSLMFLKGDIGEVLSVVPVVMSLVLFVSLIEAFIILPNHLAHGGAKDRPNRLKVLADRSIDWLRLHWVGPAARWAVRNRYFTLGSGVFLFLLSFSMMAGGILKFQAFPSIDGNQVEARIELAASAPLERTEAVVDEVLSALSRAQDSLADQLPDDTALIEDIVVRYNENADAGTNGAYLATINVDLLNAEDRTLSNDAILAAWRSELPNFTDIRRLVVTEGSLGPAGRAIEMRLFHHDLERLKAASEELQQWFSTYQGAYNISDDLQAGKPELQLTLKDGAGALGLDARMIANQIRAAFYGVTVDEIQIGAESYEIDLRLDEAGRNSLGDLDHFTLRTPEGSRVPLFEVATVSPERGFTRINRIDGRPAVTITGDIDTAIANASEMVADAEQRFLPDLLSRYPGLSADTEGQNAEAAETGASMLRGVVIGLMIVFLLLSFQFQSYAEPLVVMAIIPFALIGAVFGHLLMGLDFTLPSMLGLISLAGIVVNDSILLVNFIKNEHAAGVVNVADAAPKGAVARFRAILLTSITTIAGLLPLLFETSLQAQILVPLVTSIAFGMLATTLLMVLIVPAFYTILDDFGLTSLARERRRLAAQADQEATFKSASV